ncbi:MAG: zeta toxin family protein [Spongiibacteraceae bacterium]
MTNRPQLWMLVGGNGSGKTTFYYKFLEPLGIHFINADLIARDIAPDQPEAVSYEAAQIAEQIRLDLLSKGISFCFETVFSHPSKIEFVQHAQSLGYEIIMVFIHLDNVQLNIARISQRVVEGGHYVPDEKVAGRLERLVKNIQASIPLVDRLVIFDNSHRLGSFNCQLEYVGGGLCYQAENLKPWAMEFINKR